MEMALPVLGAVVIIIIVLVLIVPGCAEAEIVGIKVKKCPGRIEETSSDVGNSSGVADDIQVTAAPRLPSVLTVLNQ